MRLLILAAALCLSACGAPQTPATAAAGCDVEEMHEVVWSAEGAADVISARAEGPSCAQAVVTLSVRNSAGDPLWVFSTTYYDLRIGGAPPPNAEPVTTVEMEAVLSGWARVTEMRASALPEWREGMSRPGEGVTPLGYESPFERELYEAMRQRDLPTLCYAAAAEAVQCMVIDPASHAPTILVAYGP